MSNGSKRVLGFIVFLACVATAGGGIWYVRRAALEEEAADEDDDEDDDPAGVAVDGGPARRSGKKKPGARPGKPSAPRRAAGGAAAHAVGPGGPSYEAAIAGNNVQLAPGTKDAPDLTDLQLSGPMRNATFLDACGVPTSTHVTVKVAIRGGRAVGVSVYTIPPSPPLAACVDRRVRGLRWPSSAKMDSFVTTY